MPQETIRALAAEIAHQTILSNWLIYAVLAALTVVLSAAGAFLSSYFSKRGERLAVSADFEELKQQLRESTLVSESIKSDIQHLATRSEKLRSLKSEKLESYLVAILKSSEFLSVDIRHRFFDAEPPDKDDPLNQASMLQKLYLPELDDEHALFLKIVAAFRTWVAEGMQQRLAARKAGKGAVSPSDSHLALYPRHLD